MTKIKDMISSYVVRRNVSIMDINAYLDEMSEDVRQKLTPIFSEFGIRVVNFFINSANVPEEDSAVQQLKAALAKKAEMDIVGYSYQQERSFDTMQTAAANEGGGSGLMNAGMGLAMGLGIGGGLGNAMGQMTQQIVTNPTKECPKCKTANSNTSKFCASCGQALLQETQHPNNTTCVKCDSALVAGTKFCGNCGNAVVVSCSKCKATLQGGTRV